MAILNSKTLIRAHALFLFVLAVYLTSKPEVLTDSDIVFMLGEAMKIDIPTFASPQSPFAFCGVLLIADALVDLIIVSKVPQINELLAHVIARNNATTSSSNPNTNTAAAPPDTLAVRAGALYSEIWTLLAASRFCLFFAVSFFIYQSKPAAWGVSEFAGSGAASGAVPSGLDQLKNRVVFTYGFMETVFWFWILLTLRDERRETAVRVAALQLERQNRAA